MVVIGNLGTKTYKGRCKKEKSPLWKEEENVIHASL
jgi:hypothetical protein